MSSWRGAASCAALPPGEADRLFFPHPSQYPIARKRVADLCAGCLVRSECMAEGDELESVLGRRELTGIRAGETPADRVARRAALAEVSA